MTRLTVLAAGVGSRLWPVTAHRPKCLVEVGRQAIVDRLLAQAEATGRFSEAVLVSGFRREVLEDYAASWNRAHGLPVRCVHNAAYADTNTLVSAALGVRGAGGDCVVVDGDLVLDPEIVDRVALCSASALVVDTSRPLDAEAVKCRVDDEGHLCAVSKDVDPTVAQAESIGMCYLAERDVDWFATVAAALIDRGRLRDYYEAAFEAMLADGWRPVLVDAAGHRWEEVDDHEDLRRAVALVRGEAAPARAQACGLAVDVGPAG